MTMLEGIRVLDLSRVIAGPYCATLMGDLGADVVKVERPGRGDDLRWTHGDGMSAVFAAINRNKRGIAVDLQARDSSSSWRAAPTWSSRIFSPASRPGSGSGTTG
jgi:crotonobetainyl-CoA:carnitine CoA-transferase CaiB-like acyl-CoA transferase